MSAGGYEKRVQNFSRDVSHVKWDCKYHPVTLIGAFMANSGRR